MNRKANLFATVTMEWQDWNSRHHECDIEVSYTFDGENLKITKCMDLGDTSSCDDYDDRLHAMIMEIAPQAYAEDMAEYGEYLLGQHADFLRDQRDCA